MRGAATGMRSLLTRLGCSVIMLTLLAGCASLPTSSSPVRVEQLATDSPADTVFSPDGPKPGATETEIISGFIRAGNAPTDNYSVAREFLTPELAELWNPGESTRVVSTIGSPQALETAQRIFEVDISAVAQVDEGGGFQLIESDARSQLAFEVERVAGEWRIAQAPNGTTLTQADFDVVFRQQTLYFLNQNRSYLVPDIRWFPGGSTSATNIVTALLDGPSEWLQRAAVSAFPEGTDLAVDSVTSDDQGVAVIPLTAEVLAAGEVERQLMYYQLEASLASVAALSGVRITVNDTDLELPDSQIVTPQRSVQPDSRPVILTEETLGFYASGAVEALVDVPEQVDVPAQLTGQTVSGLTVRGENTYFATNAGLSRLSGGVITQLLPGEYSSVSVDSWGFIWGVGDGQISVVNAAGQQQELAIPDGLGTVTSGQISTDSARLATLTRQGNRTVVSTVAVVRDAQGAPQSLTLGDTVDIGEGVPVDVAWFDELHLAAVLTVNRVSQTILVTVGGQLESVAERQQLVAIAAGGGRESVRVLDANGVLYALRGSNWLEIVDGVRAVGYAW